MRRTLKLIRTTAVDRNSLCTMICALCGKSRRVFVRTACHCCAFIWTRPLCYFAVHATFMLANRFILLSIVGHFALQLCCWFTCHGLEGLHPCFPCGGNCWWLNFRCVQNNNNLCCFSSHIFPPVCVSVSLQYSDSEIVKTTDSSIYPFQAGQGWGQLPARDCKPVSSDSQTASR